MKILRNLLKISLFAVPLIGLSGWLVIEEVLPWVPIKPHRVVIESETWRLPNGVSPEDYGLESEKLDILTPDSIHLKALWLSPGIEKMDIGAGAKLKNQVTVIALHGIGSCKETNLPLAKNFAEHGISLVALDLRAHGESGGEFCTFGFREKFDISALIDTLLNRNPNQNIGIIGNSLGGAIALQCLAHDKRLKFGVIESTFHDFEMVAREYGEDYTGFKSDWMTRKTLKKSGQLAGFDPFSIKPFLAAQQIYAPVFVAHGDRDEKIPIGFGKINFENLASKNKEWYTIPGAGHNGVRRSGGEEYYRRMMAFLDSSIADLNNSSN